MINVFIALYRGINVGGNNPVKMQSLRALHERLGHQDIQSYIQSGNVVFRAKGSARAVAQSLMGEFAKEYGYTARIMLASAEQWGELVSGNPYRNAAAENPRAVHAGLCDGEPGGHELEALLARTGGSETFTIQNRIIYLHTPDGLGKSKFAAGMEKACGMPITIRNWRTVEALWKLTSGGLRL